MIKLSVKGDVMSKNSFIVLIAVLSLLCYSKDGFSYPSDLKDQIALVFNTLTGKDCHNFYDTAAAIYRDQANKYNADITTLTSYQKAKRICEENRLTCEKDNDELLFDVSKIKNEADGFKIATIDFYTKSHKHLVTKCNFLVNTKDNNRGYPISFPELSQNLESCVETLENKGCVTNILTNIYLGLETIP